MSKELIEKIEAAFDRVSPGGVGVREASAMDSRLGPGDSYDDPEAYQQARDADAKETDWRQIPFDVLGADPAIFSAFDEEGFRFVLPAMMRWRLSEGYRDESDVIDFLLMKLIPYDERGDRPTEFAKHLKLTADQIQVVAEWLEIVCADDGKVFEAIEQQHFDEWMRLCDAS